MLRIVSHLEWLLMVHDFVTVPQIGGFVLQPIPASYHAAEHRFSPMRKEIMFNTTLKHNDGLLLESYMDSYHVDYPGAYRMLQDDVNEIKDMLYKGLTVSLGTIGSFRRGKEGQIIFLSAEANPFGIESYGLETFQLRTLRSLQKEEAALVASEQKKEKDTFYIPINRKVLRGIASVAAAIALFLIVSTPVKELDTSAYTASFIPTTVISNRAGVQPIVKVNKEVATPTYYYVVVSSVNSLQQADECLARMNRSVFKRANKIKGGNKIRVYADKFNSKEKADAYLSKLRTNPKYADAWVYSIP
ncbi:hypothetical protein M2459_002445 [Parabacteroides sp. PF5-5]|uniref:HU domain-containing protein n=1 Tax=unclassified Parabacteroides TaxID=2649774 RepID=UPI002474DC61|nr:MULTISPECIES: SPOR domain-containing protein [unclassified Parabacteroides]MDH6316698.1 hypothetical protein [Parabacteroides sp. PF5-13]MDH6327799.1 hypothetical protein [Parabacteroides sp. PH5-41]MDH6335685.1 hypothetical protein [Parabacteroides sp. PF5-5]MDH6361711.1 hypothetical protein [Parabacteroides sp. PH5-16]